LRRRAGRGITAPMSIPSLSGGPAARGAADPAPDFSHVETWIFDLDNTLYPADCNLFAQIDARMQAFIEDRFGLDPAAARRLQKGYYAEYGTTLAGLMRVDGVKPEDFLGYVHDIDLSPVDEHPELAAAIERLPGRRYVLTNGSVAHAENVMGKLGISGLFDDVFDIEAAEYLPKPHAETYARFLARHGVETPGRAAMFEDLAVNLVEPHALGMTTVLVQAAADWIGDEPAAKRPARPGERHDHVHHATEDLAAFLAALRTAEGDARP